MQYLWRRQQMYKGSDPRVFQDAGDTAIVVATFCSCS